ncbi:hypothetical protein N7470_007112 [Penicillium chermesinum]|nr:hypothetical protein N7470_007112 [Penicillium chermesinum]
MTTDRVAIIGTGLSGLALGLALHNHSIPVTIYESRPISLDIGGAIMLSPNALRVLGDLGVYETTKALGYQFSLLHFYTGKPLDAQLKQGLYELPLTLMDPDRGPFIIAPQRVDGAKVLIGKRKRDSDDRQGWNDLLENERWCPLDEINIWPFYVVPRLGTWASQHSRVVILGNAAHVIPPTAGQGINQAFEDIYTYALSLAKCQGQKLNRALQVWQRVDRVLELNSRKRMVRLHRIQTSSRSSWIGFIIQTSMLWSMDIWSVSSDFLLLLLS